MTKVMVVRKEEIKLKLKTQDKQGPNRSLNWKVHAAGPEMLVAILRTHTGKEKSNMHRLSSDFCMCILAHVPFPTHNK